MRIVGAAVFVLPALLGGCGTFENGAADEVPVVTNPPGASVKTSVGVTSSGPNCITPCKIYVDRRDEFTVTITKPGFVAQEVEVKSRFVGGGGATGAGRQADLDHSASFVIDNLTGATLEHIPDPVVVKLDPEE